MSPTNDQPTTGSGPLSLISRMSVDQLEGDHATPEPHSEPLIPSLSSLLLLPLLDDILHIRDEGEQLSHGLRSALSQRSVQEQHRIRSFAHNLCHQHDSLYGASLTPVIQEIDVQYRQSYKQLDDSDDVKQSTFQRTDDRDPQSIHVEGVDEGGELTSDAFCTAFFTPIMETVASGEMTSDAFCAATFTPILGTMASGASASVAGATIITSSPNVMPSIAPTSPDRTTSPIGLTSSPGNSRATYKPLLDRRMSPDKWRSSRLVAARRRKRKAMAGEQDSLGEKDKRQKKANGTE